MNLKSQVSPARRSAGQFVAAALLAAASLAAWASQPATPAARLYNVTLELPGANPRLQVRAGEPATVTVGEGDAKWSARFVVTPQGDEILMKTAVSHGGKELPGFSLQMPAGQPGKVLLTDGGEEFNMTVRASEVAPR